MFTQWFSFPAVFTSICNRVYLKSPLIAQSAWPVLCSGHGPLRLTSEQLCAVLELQGQADAISHLRAVKAECRWGRAWGSVLNLQFESLLQSGFWILF